LGVLDVEKFSACFFGIPIDVERDEERPEEGVLLLGIDLGPLAVAPIGKGGGQTPALRADGLAAEARVKDKG